MKKIKRMMAVLLTMIMVLSLNCINVFAEENSYCETEDSKTSNSDNVNICEEQVLEDANNYLSDSTRINRSASCYCSGGGNWGIIIGDNNAVGEGVYVTNLSSKKIEVQGYTENGTLRGSSTINPGDRAWFGFWIWDGTYYFKVRFKDLSSGTITIEMKSDWHINESGDEIE